MSKIHNVDSLEFDSIKSNIKNFLRTIPEFTDYNFEGSAMSMVIDVLAYNTHYNSLYTNMMLNESFLDSASKYSSVVSLAKSIGYTAKSAKSSIAKLRVKVSDVPNSPEVLNLPKHTSFKSTKGGKEYSFYTQDIYSAPRVADTYTFEIDVVEGFPISNYYVNNGDVDFIIPNKEVDLTTVRVMVQESSTSSRIRQYYRVDDILYANSETPMFYVKQREDLFYQIYFGDGSIGKTIEPGNVIFIDYMVSKGEESNGCSAFYYASGARGDSLYEVSTIQNSAGGADPESIESIKFNAPRNYISQNRAVTSDDYKNQILSNFPMVQTVAVWGGQDNNPPQYGRVFISAKPFGRSKLNDIEKKQIVDFLSKKRSIVSVQHVLVDPTIIEIGVDVNVYYNTSISTKNPGVLKQMVRSSIEAYDEELNVFESNFRFSRLSRMIDSTDPSILSNVSRIYLVRTVTPNIGVVDKYQIELGNPIFRQEGTIRSSRIRIPMFEGYVTIQNDESGDLYIYDYTSEGIQRKTNTKIGHVNYEKGTFILENLRINSLFDPTFEFRITPLSNDVLPVRQNILSIPSKRTTVNVIAEQNTSDANSHIFSASR